MSLKPERVFAAFCRYAPDAGERRAPVRPAHLERIERLMADGTVLLAGAYGDMSGSLLLIRAADEAAVRALLEPDVYVASGVWAAIEIRPFDRLAPES